MGKKPKLNVDKEEFIAMYQDHNQYEVASHFNICLASVHKLRKQYEIPKKRKILYTNDENEFRRLYSEGVTYREIVKKLKISKAHIYYVRNGLGLPYRYGAYNKNEGDSDI